MAFRVSLAVATAAAFWSSVASADVKVVASIKPIHSLVSAVMEGVGTPGLLVDGASSPHTFAMRPSTATALANAGVVFWVGDSLEGFLVRPIAALTADATVVSLIETPGLTLLPMREGGTFAAHDHHHGAEDGDGHSDEAHHGEDHDEAAHHDDDAHHEESAEHDHGVDGDADHHEMNPHVWLDPRNAQKMVDEIAHTLAAADPANAALYQANAAAERERLGRLEEEIAAELAPVAGARFIVFHDAYPYFEARFGVETAGSITVNPEVSPGAAQLGEIRHAIETLDARCVFAEPQFEPRLVTSLVAGTAAGTGALDPLGVDIPAGPDQYAAMMRANAEALATCLSARS